jgi:hypothetical protein
VIQFLIAATVDNDILRVNELIMSDLGLANVATTEEVLSETIAHWIYVGDTPLHVAAAGYRIEIAEALLTAGADVKAKNRRHAQPLHYASDGSLEAPNWNADRQVAMLRLLLDAGADTGAQDKNGATPLHRAVRTRCSAAVRYLLQAGADPAIRNKPGSTPFHLAVQNTGRGGSGSDASRDAQREIIEAFLKRGVSPTLADEKSLTVLDWAKTDWIRQLLNGGSG